MSRASPGGALKLENWREDPDTTWRLRARHMVGSAGGCRDVRPGGGRRVRADRAAPCPPRPEPSYKFSGLMFGDFYYFGQHHDPAWEGQQAFWFRRIYFTFDYTFTPKLTTRLRLEANSDGKLARRLPDPLREGRLPALDVLRAPADDAGHRAVAEHRLRRGRLGTASCREDPARPLQVGLVARHGPHPRRAAERQRHAQLRRPVRHRTE